MIDKEILHVRYAKFLSLVNQYDTMGMTEENIIYHLSIFLGKYAFDNALSYQRATAKINDGVNIGRQWSMDAFEASEY